MAILPPKLLKVQMLTQDPVGFWEATDDALDPWIGSPISWNVELAVEPQVHSSHLTSNMFAYDGTDIAVGDWIATSSGGTAIQITKIIEATSGKITVEATDVDGYNLVNDPTTGGTAIGPIGAGYVFSLSAQGLPVLPSVLPYYLDVSFQTDLISRFAYLQKPAVGGGNGDHIKNDTATTGVYTQLEDRADQIVFQQNKDQLILSHHDGGWDLKAVGSNINDAVDIVIQPQNNGAVIIGNEGNGYIESSPGEDLTFRGNNIRLETHQDGEVILGNAGDGLLRTDDGNSLTLEATGIIFEPRNGPVRVSNSDAYLELLRADNSDDALITKGFLDGFVGGSSNPVSTYVDSTGVSHRIMKITIDDKLIAVFSGSAFLLSSNSIDGMPFAALEPGVIRPGLNLNTPLAAGLHGTAYNSVKLEGLAAAAFLRQDRLQTGDLAVGNAGKNATHLPIGASNQVLTVVDGTPAWMDPQGGEPDRISAGDTAVETNQVENTITVTAAGRRVINFTASESAVDEQLSIRTEAGKIKLAVDGIGKTDLELANPNGGRIRFLATGDASIRSGVAESLLVKPGDSETSSGANLTLAGGNTKAAGETGGHVIIQPGSSGSGGEQGQVKLPVGYTPADMDSVVPKHYVDDMSLNSLAPPTGNVSMNNQRMVDLAAPSANSDAANKQYVDSRSMQMTTHVVTSGDVYRATSTDHVILVIKNTASATTIELPETEIVGRVYLIKDAAGTAGEHAITITASASKLDGANSYVLNIAYSSITAMWNGSGWSML